MATGLDVGGDEGDRTPDLLNAIQALSQLSYAPKDRLSSQHVDYTTWQKEGQGLIA